MMRAGWTILCVFALSLLTFPVHAQTAEAILSKDVARGSDHPLTGRYKDSVLIAQTVRAFDELVLASGPAEGKSYEPQKLKFTDTVTAQGRVTRSIYITPPGRSSLEVMTNFAETVIAKGFQPVYRCSGESCGESFFILKYRWDRPATKVLGENYDHVRRALVDAAFDQLVDLRYMLLRMSTTEGETHVAIYGGVHRGGQFGDFSRALGDRVGVLVEVVEPKSMEKRMDMVSAQEIGGNLAKDGKAIFYGIFFDFDKAELKQESEPQLSEMAKFLKENSKTRVYIVGHTDGKGKLDYNTGLSAKRAASVTKALSEKFGIAKDRLSAKGLGSLAPVATNRTEDGRAKNRRVEMVEQ